MGSLEREERRETGDEIVSLGNNLVTVWSMNSYADLSFV